MLFNQSKIFLVTSSLLYCVTTNAFAVENNTILKIKHSEPYTSYLKPNELANSLALLPPPPAKDSPAFAADQLAYKKGHDLINTPRWALAQSDANLADSNVGKPFEHALGVTISEKDTPTTYHLIRQVMMDSGVLGTNVAKDHYKRTRPFVYYHTQTCWPQDDHLLKDDGSYPSGHSAFGWSTALILSEMFPQKQNQILQRGYDFGESRVICGAHWQSDVDAGRIIGAEVVAKLHTNKQFMQDFQKSKEELAKKMKQ